MAGRCGESSAALLFSTGTAPSSGNGAGSKFQATSRRYLILLKPSDALTTADTSSATTEAQTMPTRKKRGGTKTPTKLFVLDTNVLMHDPTSLFRFEEHDVFLPIST